MKKYLVLLLLCMLMVSMVLSGCDPFFPPNVTPTPTGGTNGSLTWTNQIKMPGANWVRDAYIFSANGNWYMTGTRRIMSVSEKDDPEGAWPGYFLWKSTDNMNNWTEVGWLLKNSAKEAEDDLKWAHEKLWAPEIKQNPNNGKFYMTYSAGVRQYNDDGTLQIDSKGVAVTKAALGLAVADNPEGPWKNLTPDKPLTDNNDGSLFFDNDGKVYVWQTGWTYFQIDLDKLEKGESQEIVKKDKKAELAGATGSWCDGAKINEGSHMIKIKDTYYLFWSCNAWGYFVGYATAKNIDGPYTANSNNPIWGAANAENEVRLQTHPIVKEDPKNPFDEVGHGTPFIGPDGKWWIVGHGRSIQRPDPTYNQPLPCMDRLNFNEATGEFTGRFTWTEQTVTW